MTNLVIGATGTVGRQVVCQLVDTGIAVRAMARRPEAAGLPPEVQVVRGDLTAPESLEACLDGVETLFLVWTAPRESAEAALERIARRVRRIVYLSAPFTIQHPFFQGALPNPSADLHAHNERLIAASGMEWTILRPGMFAANALHFWALRIRAGVVRWPYLDTPTAPIDERDIAAVAVRALCENGYAGREYVLTGPESLTQREQILTIARVVGREPRIEEISSDDARFEWTGFLPDDVVKHLLDAWAGGRGHPAYITHTVEEVTGVRARTFRQWAADHADLLAGVG
jgi:uncharacterized protein YbjT (DUF2867 family)